MSHKESLLKHTANSKRGFFLSRLMAAYHQALPSSHFLSFLAFSLPYFLEVIRNEHQISITIHSFSHKHFQQAFLLGKTDQKFSLLRNTNLKKKKKKILRNLLKGCNPDYEGVHKITKECSDFAQENSREKVMFEMNISPGNEG